LPANLSTGIDLTIQYRGAVAVAGSGQATRFINCFQWVLGHQVKPGDDRLAWRLGLRLDRN
jgi:hypothetical protein